MRNTRRHMGTAGEQGFSLIELLIAMVVTLIVCGAVVSLLVEGNRSFQIQPDLTERQQNIRAAMDMIMRDVANAGAGVTPTLGVPNLQVFSRVVSVAGVSVPVYGAGPAAPAGGNSDILEMLTNENGVDPMNACWDGGQNVRLQTQTTSPFPAGSTVVLLMRNGTYSIRTITFIDSDNGGGTRCSGGPLPRLNFNSGSGDASGRNVSGGVCGLDAFGMGSNTEGNNKCEVEAVLSLDVVRYYIGPDPNEATNPTPVLFRQTGATGAPGQIVARGIEDMRVTYRSGADITATPGATQTGCPSSGICPLPLTQPADLFAATTVAAAYDASTVEVQVELAARGSLYNAPGARQTAPLALMTEETDLSRAYRGRLVSRGTPRAALYPMTTRVDVLETQRWK
jgi:prepilin-type N-terminal cleavage/methylation domain-containing protein